MHLINGFYGNINKMNKLSVNELLLDSLSPVKAPFVNYSKFEALKNQS